MRQELNGHILSSAFRYPGNREFKGHGAPGFDGGILSLDVDVHRRVTWDRAEHDQCQCWAIVSDDQDTLPRGARG